MTGPWSSRRVLVTGGASFIGSHLVERLVELGAHVRVADDLSSGRRAYLRAVASDIEFLRGDLRNPSVAARACRGRAVVFHLAARHGGRGYIDTHPADCASNAVLDGVVFEQSVKARVGHVCFASSACIYPTALQQRTSGRVRLLREEDADHTAAAQPDGEYGWAKWMGELALAACHRQHGLSASICRLFTIYGERANETHAMTALIAKARLRLDPYPVWGSGAQRRDFTYVADAVDGLLRAAERVTDATPINIGSDEVVTVGSLADSILDAVGFVPRRVVFDAKRPTGVLSRAADTSRARRLLGWRARTTLEDGLARTVDWHRRHRRESLLSASLNTLLTERT